MDLSSAFWTRRVLKGRTFRCAVKLFSLCHPQPTLVGEGSAFPQYFCRAYGTLILDKHLPTTEAVG
jgi:hypothetical protein